MPVSTKRVNGVVVAVPREDRVYLVTEVPTAFGMKQKIIPFEKVPIEERVLKTLHTLGEDVKVIAKELISSMKVKEEKTKAKVKEVM